MNSVLTFITRAIAENKAFAGRKTGEMAYNILVNGEDITKMKVEAAPNVTKEYIKDRCDTYGIKVPDGYTEIKAE